MAVNFHQEALSIENQALNTMLRNNLNVHQPDPGTRDNWRALLGEDFSALVGDDGIISTESYEKVASMLDDFRSR